MLQTALSVALLVSAGLFVRSLNELRAQRLGYDVDRLLYVQTSLRNVKLQTSEGVALSDRLLDAARATPGVVSATPVASTPFTSFEGRRLYVPGIDSVSKLGRFLLQTGSADYFVTTGTRVLQGRGIEASDRANAPRVVVVSESMARTLWQSNANALGKCVRIGSDTMPCTTVVGIAEDIKAEKITADGERAYYLPIAQYREQFGQIAPWIFVRVHGNGIDYAESVRARLQRELPGASYVTVIPFREIVAPELRAWSSGATMFLVFGALALALAAIGLYAVIAFSVAQRSHDIGLRIALGAQVSDVLRLVVGEGLRVTFVGVMLGVAIAVVAGRALAPLLFHISPHDPAVYASVAALLLIVGVLASAIPASRAAHVDPNVALRAD
jgi:predicted permease